MADPQERPWTVDEFFAWQERQTERHELVNGLPLRMTAGAKNRRDDIVVNVLTELRDQLRNSGCRPFTGDGAVETYPGKIGRPDVGVDCGKRDPDGCRAEAPRLVLEVLSPTTRDFGAIGKLAEYKTVSSLDYILFVEPNEPFVAFWSRIDGAWREDRVATLDARLDLPTLGASLAMGSIYEGVAFPERPAIRALDPR